MHNIILRRYFHGKALSRLFLPIQKLLSMYPRESWTSRMSAHETSMDFSRESRNSINREYFTAAVRKCDLRGYSVRYSWFHEVELISREIFVFLCLGMPRESLRLRSKKLILFFFPLEEALLIVKIQFDCIIIIHCTESLYDVTLCSYI